MLRVLHVISGDLWAGAEVMAFQLLKNLNSRSDVQLKVILLNHGRLASELQNLGVLVEIIPEVNNSFIISAIKLRSAVLDFCPDVLHAHRYKENLLALIATCFGRRVRLVTTQHGLPEATKGRASLLKNLVSWANLFVLRRYFDRTAAVSESVYEYFIKEHGFNAKNVEIIHNGIAIDEDGDSLDERSCDSFVIGSSGRLFPVKDYALMIEISRQLSHQQGITFSLAGEGPERQRLEGSINHHSLERIFELKGQLDEMTPFYRGLKIYLNTSLHEGIPMAILEAMAQGLPVIAPKVGGIPEIIDDGVEGFLIESRDPQLFAEKCLQLYHDKNLWKKMSKAARSRVCQEFSASAMADRYLCCYRKLLG